MQIIKKTIVAILSIYLIGCGGSAQNEENNNKKQKIVTNEYFVNINSKKALFVLNNNSKIEITKAPKYGKLIKKDNKYYYEVSKNYLGVDSFEYKIDKTYNKAEIYIYNSEINITKPYEIINLDSNSIYTKINLPQSVKNLYIIFTNPTQNEYQDFKVFHNVKSLKNSKRVVSLQKNYKNIYEPKDVLEFNSKAYTLLHESTSTKRYKKLFKAYQVGDSEIFYIDNKATKSVDAKLVKVVKDINTTFGLRSLRIWVDKKSYKDSCIKTFCIYDNMVDKLADKFLKDGKNNDIYDYVTNIFGAEWEDLAHQKYDNLIPFTGIIDILLTDIDNDNSINGGIIGYFNIKDEFRKSTVRGSNEKVMFYIDSVMFANESNNYYWQKETFSTLAHEAQHMINFYQKEILQNRRCSTWLNEMLSLATEDLLSNKLQTFGDRGVSFEDGSAGDKNNKLGRYSIFNQYNNLSITTWDNDLPSYAKESSFAAFLIRNYGGAKLLREIVKNKFTNQDAIIQAIKKVTNKNITFENLLKKWAIAVVFSDNDNLEYPNLKYNIGDFFNISLDGINYKVGSINFFNYNPTPKFNSYIDIVKPQANYYYKLGESIENKTIYLNLKLNNNTKAILLSK